MTSQDAPSGRTYRQVPTDLPPEQFRQWFEALYIALTGRAATGSAQEWQARYERLRTAFEATKEKES